MAVIKPLAAGRYLARCKEATRLKAAANGHSTIWPQAEAVSDGLWVHFYRDGVAVFDCNAQYASAHFVCTTQSE
jgi:hypothetical protein